MPQLIKWTGQAAVEAEDPYTAVADSEPTPQGDVIISLQRFQAEGRDLLDQGRKVGVRVEPSENVEDLAGELKRLSLVALSFPKHLQGQAFSSAAVLRERGFQGEIRAVGDVLREQARFMVRVGFDAFEPIDGSTPAQWAHVVGRFRHVYQRAQDGREPAFVERQEAAHAL